MNTDNILSFENFCIDDYLVSLFKYGYSYSGHGNCISEAIDIDKRINLKPISNDLSDNKYIKTVFLKNLSEVDHLQNERIFVFHTLYQIIELLISKIFEVRFNELFVSLHENPTDLYNARDELSSISAEKSRVNDLFAHYTKLNSNDCGMLRERCKCFLSQNSIDIKNEEVSNLLYQVRCLVFHNMYSVDEASLTVLEEINKVFVDIVLDMIVSFKLK